MKSKESVGIMLYGYDEKEANSLQHHLEQLLDKKVFVISAVMVKLSSPGPVFFIQDRVGLNKRIFKMYKFSLNYSMLHHQ